MNGKLLEAILTLVLLLLAAFFLLRGARKKWVRGSGGGLSLFLGVLFGIATVIMMAGGIGLIEQARESAVSAISRSVDSLGEDSALSGMLSKVGELLDSENLKNIEGFFDQDIDLDAYMHSVTGE